MSCVPDGGKRPRNPAQLLELMSAPKRFIEVDEQTAIALEASAAERGLSVSALVAEMARVAMLHDVPSADDVAELDRRWAAIEAGEPTIPHDSVVRWLRTWGSPAFKSWRHW
jgi:hypothetical protein